MGVQFNKPCLGCRQLARGASYCPSCQPPKPVTPQRQQRKAFLYGGTYKARARLIKQTATHCHLCGKPFLEGESIEADHVLPELGSDSPLAPAHRHCNQSRSNKPLA